MTDEPELRAQAITCSVARTFVAVHYTSPGGAPCVRVGKVVAVTERHMVISSSRHDEPQGVPFTAVTRIETLDAAPPPGGPDGAAAGR